MTAKPAEKPISNDSVARAKDGAIEWLRDEADGYPRSWAQEKANDVLRGYVIYDFEAPPIAGYEELEKEGKVVRVGTIQCEHEERVHFRLVP